MVMKKLSPSAILQELIRIPSVSSMSNRPLIQFVRSILEGAGWHFRELPYRGDNGVEKLNLLATPPWQNPADFSVDLAFVCHTDTVPYDASWMDAVDPQVEGGVMRGCGACDVKGFLACILAAVAGMPSEHVVSAVAIVLTAEEEVGCRGAKHILDSGLLQARHIVVGEPTSLHPARGGKGYGLAEVRVFGKEAHSAHPTLGVSAIYRAARLIERIEQYASLLAEAHSVEPAQIFDPPHTTLNVGFIQGGTAKNVVAGECRFLLEWRPLPGDVAGAVVNALSRMVEELRRDDIDFKCEINVLREQAGFETSPDSPLVRRWTELTGRSAIAVPFSTEAPLMTTLSKDVIVLGPGDMRTAHSERECVPLKELELCVAYVQGLLAQPLEEAQ